MTKTLVVFTDLPTDKEAKYIAQKLANTKATLLILNRDLVVSEVESVLQGQGVVLNRRLNALCYLQQAVPVARDKFKNFAAQWPVRFRKNGKNFKELFVYEQRLSLWWLTELSLKNHEARPTFGYLVKLEALRLVLAESLYDQIMLLVRNPDLRDVLAQLCQARGVNVVQVKLSPGWNPDNLLRLMAGRLKNFLMDFAVTLLAQVVYLVSNYRHTQPLAGTVVAFHTWYPLEWLDWHGQFLDRYYVDLPEFLEKRERWKTIYIGAVRPMTLKNLRKVAPIVFTEKRNLGNVQALFLERFISLFRLCLIYLDLWPTLRYLWLERCDPSFRASFSYDKEVNIFPIARYDLRVSFVNSIAPLLVQAHRVRNFVKEMRPHTLVTYLELYCYGRAVIYGARTASVGVQIIGYQHSRITRNQLHYSYVPGEIVASPDAPDDTVANMPIPDVFLLHGSHARRVLLAGGFPEERLRVCGCPRFDDLPELRRWREAYQGRIRRELGAPDDKKLIVIATAYWVSDTQQLVAFTFDATAGRDDVWLLFKPHPNYREIREVVHREAERTQQKNFALTFKNVHLLAAAADVMLTVNSTSGAEALAVGCPVINVRLTDVDLSPFVEATDAVPEVHNAAELRQALDGILNHPVDPARVMEVIEGVFYKLDGQAKQRIANVLTGV